MKAKADPKRLALWALGGALLAASGFFTTVLPGERRVLLGAFLGQALAGFGVWFIMEARLRRLYRAGAWNDAELAPTRALLEHPAWMWGTVAMFVAASITVVARRHSGGMIYLAVIPMNAISGMRRTLTPARATGPVLVDWKSIRPLYSEHWGEARRSGLLPH